MVNWQGSFTNEDLQVRSGEPLSSLEFQAPVFATRLVAKAALLDGQEGWSKLERLRKHLKDAHEKTGKVDGRAWQDLFDIEQILSRSEAVRLVPMR
jgi:hypothetical protein